MESFQQIFRITCVKYIIIYQNKGGIDYYLCPLGLSATNINSNLFLSTNYVFHMELLFIRRSK